MTTSVHDLFTNFAFLMNIISEGGLWNSSPQGERAAEPGWTPWMGVPSRKEQEPKSETDAELKKDVEKEKPRRTYSDVLKIGLEQIKRLCRLALPSPAENVKKVESGSTDSAEIEETAPHPPPKACRVRKPKFMKQVNKTKHLPVPPVPTVPVIGEPSRFSLLTVEDAPFLEDDIEEVEEIVELEESADEKPIKLSRRQKRAAQYAHIIITEVPNRDADLYKFIFLSSSLVVAGVTFLLNFKF